MSIDDQCISFRMFYMNAEGRDDVTDGMYIG